MSQEVNYDFYVNLIWLAILGPPILFGVIGIVFHFLNKRKIALNFFKASGIYLLIALGICELWLWIDVQ